MLLQVEVFPVLAMMGLVTVFPDQESIARSRDQSQAFWIHSQLSESVDPDYPDRVDAAGLQLRDGVQKHQQNL